MYSTVIEIPKNYNWVTIENLTELQRLVVKNHPLYTAHLKDVAVGVNDGFAFCIEGLWQSVNF